MSSMTNGVGDKRWLAAMNDFLKEAIDHCADGLARAKESSPPDLSRSQLFEIFAQMAR